MARPCPCKPDVVAVSATLMATTTDARVNNRLMLPPGMRRLRSATINGLVDGGDVFPAPALCAGGLEYLADRGQARHGHAMNGGLFQHQPLVLVHEVDGEMRVPFSAGDGAALESVIGRRV